MRQKYITFERGPILGVCIPDLEPHLDFFAGTFEEWLAAQPVTIFLERPNRVVALKLPPGLVASDSSSGLSVIVKRFGWRSPFHRMIRPLAGSKAIRSFRIADALRSAGTATPRPLIAWDRRAGRTAMESYYITEEIEGAITLRRIFKWGGPAESERTALFAELGRLVRDMHDAGILHRDLTIGNFLVAPKPIKGRRIFLIDLSRAVSLGRVPLLLRFADLARMKLEEGWPAFFDAYCDGRPGWKAYWPLMRALIWWRRWRMDLWKRMKGRGSL